MRGRRSKGKRKGIRARDRARGRREEGGGRRGTPGRKPLFYAIPSTNLKNNKNKTAVNDWLSNKSGRDSRILVVFLALFFFCFPKTRNLK